jgi:predicted O-methyltransferase YrrM
VIGVNETEFLEKLQALRLEIDLVFIRHTKEDYLKASNTVNELIDIIIHNELTISR